MRIATLVPVHTSFSEGARLSLWVCWGTTVHRFPRRVVVSWPSPVPSQAGTRMACSVSTRFSWYPVGPVPRVRIEPSGVCLEGRTVNGIVDVGVWCMCGCQPRVVRVGNGAWSSRECHPRVVRSGRTVVDVRNEWWICRGLAGRAFTTCYNLMFWVSGEVDCHDAKVLERLLDFPKQAIPPSGIRNILWDDDYVKVVLWLPMQKGPVALECEARFQGGEISRNRVHHGCRVENDKSVCVDEVLGWDDILWFSESDVVQEAIEAMRMHRTHIGPRVKKLCVFRSHAALPRPDMDSESAIGNFEDRWFEVEVARDNDEFTFLPDVT